MAAGLRDRIGSSRPEIRVKPRKATNHGIDSSAVKKNSVPIAATSAHRLTALDAM